MRYLENSTVVLSENAKTYVKDININSSMDFLVVYVSGNSHINTFWGCRNTSAKN